MRKPHFTRYPRHSSKWVTNDKIVIRLKPTRYEKYYVIIGPSILRMVDPCLHSSILSVRVMVDLRPGWLRRN